MSTTHADHHRTRHVPTAPVRASDAERESVVTALHRALGEGRLDLAETESRVAAAYAATHRDELTALLADLPGPSAGPGATASTWSDLWAALVWRARGVLFGPAAAGGAPPGPGERRVAARLVALAVVWTVLCAVAAAAVVA